MLEKIKEFLSLQAIGKFLGKLIRKLLAGLSGYLIAKWGIDAALVQNFEQAALELIIALLPGLLALIWGWIKAKI